MRPIQRPGLLFLLLLAIAATALVIIYRDAASKFASRGGGEIPTAAELEYPELHDDENAAFLYRAAWNTLDALPEGIDQEFMSDYTQTILARIGVTDDPEQPLSDSDLLIVDLLLAEADPAYQFLRQVRTTKACLFLKDHRPEAPWQHQEKRGEVL